MGSSVVVIADKGGSKNPAEPGPHAESTEWHGEAALSLVMRLAGFFAQAPVVFAGAHQSDLILAVEREGRFERRRLVGSAPDALTGAVRAIVAVEAGCSPSEVALSVLGPPGGFVVPWSEASIGGYAVERVLSQVQLRRVEARVTNLWPPGPNALGLAAARVAEALVSSGRRAANVLTVLGGEFGVRDRVGALPCLLGPQGIVSARLPDLNTRERVQLETALGRHR
jgi:malate/lactate dehydrogenase